MPVDLSKIKNDLSKFSSGNFWKPKSGKNYVRILPPWSENIPVYYYAVHLHWVGNRYVLCSGEGCLVCAMLKDSAFATVLKDKIQTMDKFLVNMVDLENPSAGVQIWGMPVTVWRALNQYFLDPKWGDLTDLNRGRNITIVREGTGAKDTKYQVYPDPEPTPFDPSIMSGLKDLSTVFEELPFDKLAELLQGENIHLTPNLPEVAQGLPSPNPSNEGVTPQNTGEASPPPPPPPPTPQEVPVSSNPATTTSQTGGEASKQFDPQKMQDLLNKLMNKG